MTQPTRFSLKQLLLGVTVVSVVLGAVVAFGLRGVAVSMLALSLWTIYYGYSRHRTGIGCIGYMLTAMSACFLYYVLIMYWLMGSDF